MKLKSHLILPVTHLVSKRTSRLFSDVKKSLSEKLAAAIVLLAAVLFAYTVALGCGVLIAAVLLTMTKIRLFFAILIVVAYLLLLTLVTFFIGKGMMSKSISEDNRKMDIFK